MENDTRTFAEFVRDHGEPDAISYEAECIRCGETFNPSGEEALRTVQGNVYVEHYQQHGPNEAGDYDTECGGFGLLVGSWRAKNTWPTPEGQGPFTVEAVGFVKDGEVHITWQAPEPPPTFVVDVPGAFHAHYRDGEITRFVFVPHGSDAGYFGPSAEVNFVIENDRSREVEAHDPVSELQLEDTCGPFWTAVQEALAPTTFFYIGETADDEDAEVERTTVPIEWEE